MEIFQFKNMHHNSMKKTKISPQLQNRFEQVFTTYLSMNNFIYKPILETQFIMKIDLATLSKK